jgi:CRISPR-associated endoribonuclease Cas6
LISRGAYVPFHHQYLLAQTLRGILVKGGDKAFFNSTGYNFSGLKGQTRISRKGLHFFSSRVTLVVSSGDDALLEYLTASLFKQKELMIGCLQLIPESKENEAVPEFSSRAKFLCLSPLVSLPGVFNEEEGKRFIAPGSEEFSDLLYEHTLERMAESGRYTNEDLAAFSKFQIVPDAGYLKRIESDHKKFSRIYPMFDSDIRYEVRGYTFPFTLYGAPEVLSFVFENGLGRYAHKGFGMLDLADDDKISLDQPKELQYA